MPRLAPVFAITCLVLGLVAGAAPAQTADPTTDDMVRALLPHGLDGRRIKGARSADALLGPKDGRGIGFDDAPLPIPSIDLRVGFEYDSDILTNDGALLLDQLGAALAHPDLAAARIRILGHTDAVGGEAYNQFLSERRAEAVRAYVVNRHGIAPDRLEVGGMGKTALLAGIDPFDGRNRRVEVQNISAAPSPECQPGLPCGIAPVGE